MEGSPMPRSRLAEVSKIVEGVEFTVEVSRREVPVLVTREYLESRYGVGSERETWLLSFAQNRTAITRAAQERYEREPNVGVIILKD